jgi:hypothetical protein
MILDLNKVFTNTHLHLIIWNRFDDSIHQKGLILVQEFLSDPEFCGVVLPMLRPIGRPQGIYEEWNSEFTESRGDEKKDGFFWLNDHSSHCELWLQVSKDCEVKVWDKIEHWRQENNHGRTWRSRKWQLGKNPIWEPLGGTKLEECGYAGTKNGGGTRILCSINPEQVAWFLKLIWYRASVVISNKLIKNGKVKLLNPREEIDFIADLLEEIFSDIQLNDYGLEGPDDPIDPTLFNVSHMAAFAVNSVTTITKISSYCVYQIEDYYQDCHLTHPYCFRNRNDYLDAIRCAECRFTEAKKQ